MIMSRTKCGFTRRPVNLYDVEVNRECTPTSVKGAPFRAVNRLACRGARCARLRSIHSSKAPYSEGARTIGGRSP